MKKFIVLYHSNINAMEQTANSTPEEMQEGMKQWMIWAEKCGDHLLIWGRPYRTQLGSMLKVRAKMPIRKCRAIQLCKLKVWMSCSIY